MLDVLLYPVVLVASVVIPLSSNMGPGSQAAVASRDVPPAQAALPLTGMWELKWNDVVGQELVGELKSCDVLFRSVDGYLTGSFRGPVAGRERDAILQGRIYDQPEGTLLVFQQHEIGYVCSYQVFWPASAPDLSRVVGVWHDTKGRSGNFSLLRYQRITTTTIPDSQTP